MTTMLPVFGVAPTRYTRHDALRAAGVAGLHWLVAVTLIVGFGFTTRLATPWGSWDWFWQTLSLYHLRTNLGESLWYLHAQPPLFNLLGGLLAPLYPYHLEAWLWLNVFLGGVMAGLAYLLAAHFTPRRNVALAWASLISLNPALFLYEAYLLYAVLTAFLVIASVACVLWHQHTRSAWALYAFVGALNALILTRSAYHLALLPVALAWVGLVAARGARLRTLLVCAALCSVSVGWYAKNQALFGFFGASSWSGSSLWKIVSSPYDQEALRTLAEAGVIDRMVAEIPAFQLPSAYARFGFNQTSSVAVLARDDYNNINIPAISAAYGRNALALIRHNPLSYAQAVISAFGYYCLPSAHYGHLYFNLKKVVDPTQPALRGWQVLETALTALLLPGALLLYAVTLAGQCARRGCKQTWPQVDGVLLWCFGFIAYSAVTTSMLEIGENNRFKFEVEMLIWLFIPYVLSRLRARLTLSGASTATTP